MPLDNVVANPTRIVKSCRVSGPICIHIPIDEEQPANLSLSCRWRSGFFVLLADLLPLLHRWHLLRVALVHSSTQSVHWIQPCHVHQLWPLSALWVLRKPACFTQLLAVVALRLALQVPVSGNPLAATRTDTLRTPRRKCPVPDRRGADIGAGGNRCDFEVGVRWHHARFRDWLPSPLLYCTSCTGCCQSFLIETRAGSNWLGKG